MRQPGVSVSTVHHFIRSTAVSIVISLQLSTGIRPFSTMHCMLTHNPMDLEKTFSRESTSCTIMPFNSGIDRSRLTFTPCVTCLDSWTFNPTWQDAQRSHSPPFQPHPPFRRENNTCFVRIFRPQFKFSRDCHKLFRRSRHLNWPEYQLFRSFSTKQSILSDRIYKPLWHV